MKKQIFNVLTIGTILSIALLFTACGGGSGSSKSTKKLPTHEIFGNLINIVYQHNYSDSVKNAEAKTKIEKIESKGYSESAVEKITAIRTELKQDKATSKSELKEAIAKEASNLIGKKIPFEMEDGLGYEVTDLDIVKVYESGQVEADCQIKVIDIKAVKTFGNDIIISFINCDKNGNTIGKAGAAYVKLFEKANGATASYKMQFHVYGKGVEKYLDFQKVRFLKK